LSCYRAERDLSSFPTRRSSDLLLSLVRALQGAIGLAGERPPSRRHEAPVRSVQVMPPTSVPSHCSSPPTWLSPHAAPARPADSRDRKSTRLNSSHVSSSYAVFC